MSIPFLELYVDIFQQYTKTANQREYPRQLAVILNYLFTSISIPDLKFLTSSLYSSHLLSRRLFLVAEAISAYTLILIMRIITRFLPPAALRLAFMDFDPLPDVLLINVMTL